MADYDANALALLATSSIGEMSKSLYELKAAIITGKHKGRTLFGPTWLLPEIVLLENRLGTWLLDYALQTQAFYTIGDKLDATAAMFAFNDLIVDTNRLWVRWSDVTKMPVPAAMTVDAIGSFGAGFLDPFGAGVGGAWKSVGMVLLVGLGAVTLVAVIT